ncbi:hypothetical protein [Aestuariivita boseongensis]|uniref:hypothetical protein n=1 Tax=Aestuariivita boseongensis TaxID=1470562 RepID=UPI0006836B01|nr:hypothetical protein [Aestuariivita boseongensis]
MADPFQPRIAASQPRRWLGVGMLVFLGGLLIYVAFTTPPDPAWQVFLLVMGGASLWLGDKMRRATDGWIELTDEGLVTQSGEVIARMDDIEKVERGMLAFKPSNGFMLKTKTPAANRWEPGLWWRTGRRIGVGGVTPASQSKVMADLISARLIERG